MILQVIQMDVTGPQWLRLSFNNGVTRCVNALPLLSGPGLAPLKDPAYFARVVLDPSRGTVVWPNGAELSPEALLALPEENPLALDGPGVSVL